MDLSYYMKVNNLYNSSSRQETDLFLLNRYTNDIFADSIDYHVVQKSNEPFELLIIKDTDGNTHQRKIKSRPGQPFNLGEYVVWNNQTWIIGKVDIDDKTHTSGYMYLCTHVLRWQNKELKIVERPAYLQDFTKYATGTEANGQLIVGDNQYGAIVPNDEETLRFRRDSRLVIDDLFEEPDVYRLSNRKVNLDDYTDYGRGGTITLTFTIDSFDARKDILLTDDNGKKFWICDYIDPDNPADINQYTAWFSIKDDTISIGRKKLVTSRFIDKSGQEVAPTLTGISWGADDPSVVITPEPDGYTAYIFTDDKSLVNKSFNLTLLLNGVAVYTKSINVRAI